MARVHGIIKTEVWEAGSEFRRRTLPAQWAYAMLVSQPQINNCGVLPYVPEKWARFATGLTIDQLDSALAELEQHRFVVVDQDTGELLVRTFIKHDRIWKQPNLVTAARREYAAIESDRIRRILVAQHSWLTDTRPPSDVRTFEETRPTEPLPQPLFEGVTEPLPEGVPRARDAHAHAPPQPLPPPQRESPQRDSLSEPTARTRPTPAAAQQAAQPAHATNGHPVPAMTIARLRINAIGHELPLAHLDDELAVALGDRLAELTPAERDELRDLHATVHAAVHDPEPSESRL